MEVVNFLVEVIADGLIIPVVLIGGWAMLRIPKPQRYQAIARGVVMGLLALLLAKVAALFYQGQRPFVELGVEPGAAFLNNPGFPSDHTLFVFAITAVVWASTKNVRLSVLLLACSMLVGMGRVLALVHTPIDVIGGIACVFVAAIALYGRQFFKRGA